LKVKGGIGVNGSSYLATTNIVSLTIGTLSGALSASNGAVSAGTLSVSNGGTGNTAAIQWGIVFATTSSKLDYTSAGSQDQILKSNGNAAPIWGTVNLSSSNAVSGTLSVSRGGTGATTFTSGAVLLGGGTGAIATTSGTANQILRIPSAGGSPAFGSIDLATSASVGNSILAITNGGTGASTSQGARTNLLPSQSNNSDKVLKSNGTDVSWTHLLNSKSITILSPLNTDKVTMFHTDRSITLSKVSSVIRGTSNISSQWQLYHGTSRASGTAVFSATQTVTSTTTGFVTTTFSSSVMAVNSWLWLEAGAQTSVDELHITVYYS
jgi:hypothetical protein